MSQLLNNQEEQLRHERKFLIEAYAASEVEQFLKFHPACFREIYHQRTVNNIYFDTLAFASYYENLEGDTSRVKARIRWYGDLFGEIGNSVLEFKIKEGLLGKKNFYKLAPFKLNADFSRQQILLALSAAGIPSRIKNTLLSLQPVLLNSYTRKYFISEDKNFRITIDNNLLYHKISYHKNSFLNKTIDRRSVIMELKYEAIWEEQAKEIGNRLPFKLTKNSKYLQGVERVLF